MTVVAMYWMPRPSFFKRGHILNTATLLTNAHHANGTESGEAPDNSNVTGNSGNKIVFSCTWNENKKNDIDDVNSAYGNSLKIGAVEPPFVLSSGCT